VSLIEAIESVEQSHRNTVPVQRPASGTSYGDVPEAAKPQMRLCWWCGFR
jgi:hypothetical protein